MSTPIHASLTAPGDKTVTTVEAPVPILSILVHDIRSGLPIQKSPVKRLVINKEEYITNKVISEDFFNRCRKHVDIIDSEPRNLIKVGSASTQIQVKLALQKLMANSIFKLKYKFSQQTKREFSLIDNDINFDTNSTETEVLDLLNRTDYQYCTSKEGRLFIPMPNDLFKQKLTIEIGFERFAIVAETFEASGESLHRPKDPNSDLSVVWDNTITASPNFETEFFKSWGWKLWASKKKYVAAGSGNKPVDKSIDVYFKTTERFEIQACTLNANLGNFNPDSPGVEKKQKDDYLKWLEGNFNPRLLSGKRVFNLQDHFLVFGLQISSPVYFNSLPEYVIPGGNGQNDITTVVTTWEQRFKSAYNGLVMPTRYKGGTGGRDYGCYSPVPPFPRGNRRHLGIDYHGEDGVTKVFSTHFGKIFRNQAGGEAAGHGSGYGYNIHQHLGENGIVLYGHLYLKEFVHEIARPGEVLGSVGRTWAVNQALGNTGQFENATYGQALADNMVLHRYPSHLHLQYSDHCSGNHKGRIYGSGNSASDPDDYTADPPLIVDHYFTGIGDPAHINANKQAITGSDHFHLFPCDSKENLMSASACSIRKGGQNATIPQECWANINHVCPYIWEWTKDPSKIPV